MKIKYLVLLFISGMLINVQAQQLGEFKAASTGSAKKFKKMSKRLYVANFNVQFEIYKEAVDKKEAGGFRNTIKNASKAKAAVGLSSLDKDAIQGVVDQLYNEFIADFKAKGFEIISADEAGKTKVYENWKRAEGPYVEETFMPGIMSAVPSNFSFYYKDKNAFSKITDGFANTNTNLSNQMDDALIADITLIFPFTELGQVLIKGNGAEVKMFIDYRLENQYVFSNEHTGSSLTSAVDKTKQTQTLTSKVEFIQGKLPIGGSPEAQYVGTAKKPIPIEGVLKREKVTAYSKQTMATATSLNPIVVIKGSNYSEVTKWLEPDSKAYAKGMYMAAKELIDFHANELLSVYK